MYSDEELARLYALAVTLGLFEQPFDAFKTQIAENYDKALSEMS